MVRYRCISINGCSGELFQSFAALVLATISFIVLGFCFGGNAELSSENSLCRSLSEGPLFPSHPAEIDTTLNGSFDVTTITPHGDSIPTRSLVESLSTGPAFGLAPFDISLSIRVRYWHPRSIWLSNFVEEESLSACDVNAGNSGADVPMKGAVLCDRIGRVANPPARYDAIRVFLETSAGI